MCLCWSEWPNLHSQSCDQTVIQRWQGRSQSYFLVNFEGTSINLPECRKMAKTVLKELVDPTALDACINENYIVIKRLWSYFHVVSFNIWKLRYCGKFQAMTLLNWPLWTGFQFALLTALYVSFHSLQFIIMWNLDSILFRVSAWSIRSMANSEKLLMYLLKTIWAIF